MTSHLRGTFEEARCYVIGQNYAWEMVRQDKAARGGK